MVRDEAVPDSGEVELDETALRIAAEITRTAREATAGLPFGTDPSAFTAVLESLASEPPEASP